MKQGIVIESNAEYHGYKEAISKSRLCKMEICPAYFKWCEENPQEPTPDLIFGSAFHKLILEPQDFDSEFIVAPTFDRRTAQGKADYTEFISNAEDKCIISQEDYNTICGMRDSIMKNKKAKKMLQKGNIEQSFYFADKVYGEKCKARPDLWYKTKNGSIIINDYKSCRSDKTYHGADPETFRNEIPKYFYDLQAYMYTLAASITFDVPFDKVAFIFIAVEKAPPYLINIAVADDIVLESGKRKFEKYIGNLHTCKETGDWFGYNGFSGELNNASLPAWQLKDFQ